MTFDAAVLLPFRGGDEHRDRACEWVTAWYLRELDPMQLNVGAPPDGAWSKGSAVAAARGLTNLDVLVIADADCYCSPAALVDAIVLCAGGVPWAKPYTLVWRHTQRATERLLTGGSSAGPPDRAPYYGQDGGGIVVLRADVYDDCPLDPRFVGWGGEDIAWGLALNTLHGGPAKATGRCWHLWHPHPLGRPRHRPETTASAELLGRYRAAAGDVDAMRALLAEI